MRRGNLAWKRLTAAVLSAMMAVTAMPGTLVTASAAKKQADKSAVQEITVTEYCSVDEDGMSNDELFEGYLEQLFYGKRETAPRMKGYGTDGKGLNAFEKEIYNALKVKVTAIAEGTLVQTKDIEISLSTPVTAEYTITGNKAADEKALQAAAEAAVTAVYFWEGAPCASV